MSDLKNYANRTATTRGNGTPTTKNGAFRLYLRNRNTALLNERAEIEKAKAENIENLSKKLAEEKNRDLDEIRANRLKIAQDQMLKIADKIDANLTHAINKLAMIPPRPEKVLMIENAGKRFDKISDTELNMLIASVADNFQESALLHSIAEKHGKDYDLYFTPEKANEYKDKLIRLYKEKVIPFIGDDAVEHFEMANFFRYEDGKPLYGEINPLADYFDHLPIAVEDEKPIPELTNQKGLEDRLYEARQLCWSNHARALWEETISVGMDIQKNGLTTENIKTAEKLIKIVGELYVDEK